MRFWFAASQAKRPGLRDEREDRAKAEESTMRNLFKAVDHDKGTEGETSLFCANMDEKRRAEAWLADRIRRGRSSEFSERGRLTPALAEMLLKSNPDNRSVRDEKVEAFATDIRDGAWAVNGEAVKISEEGLLNDGQHRCYAVIHAARSIETYFVFGVTRESRTTLDQGTTRTSGDYLHMVGVPSANQHAAVAGMFWQYEQRGAVSHQRERRPTKAQAHEIGMRHRDAIGESIRIVPTKGSNLVGGKSVLSFCHFVFARIDRAAADDFIRRLVIGDNLSSKHPIFVLRQRLMNDKRMHLSERLELIFRTWNNYRRGRQASIVKLLGSLPVLER